MRCFILLALPLSLIIGLSGCSQKTQDEAGEAVRETGEALESAAEDAGNVVEGVVEGASDAVEENQSDAQPEQQQ